MGEQGRTASKAQRLNQIRDLLQIKPHTSTQLARRIGTTIRSIQRDLRALIEMDVPITKDSRRHYTLVRDKEVRGAFTPVEAMAVHTAIRLFARHTSEYNEHYRTAVEKLAKALPAPASESAMEAADRLRMQPNSARSKIAEDVARAWLERRRLVSNCIN
jgi:predicted DNA-binding transcriptional regulator YafY